MYIPLKTSNEYSRIPNFISFQYQVTYQLVIIVTFSTLRKTHTYLHTCMHTCIHTYNIMLYIHIYIQCIYNINVKEIITDESM